MRKIIYSFAYEYWYIESLDSKWFQPVVKLQGCKSCLYNNEYFIKLIDAISVAYSYLKDKSGRWFDTTQRVSFSGIVDYKSISRHTSDYESTS